MLMFFELIGGLLVSLYKFILYLILFLSFLFLLFVINFFLFYRINIFKLDTNKLENLEIKPKIYDLFRWLLYDNCIKKQNLKKFKEYGFTFFVGKQGAGKTISMVQYIATMKKQYPNAQVISNFDCIYSDKIMIDWNDLLEIRNGENGVIFAIDEIHTEYNTSNWKDIPDNLLSEISQQRKQFVKIIGSAQSFTRIAKPLREQAFDVVKCSTIFKGRLTVCKSYEAFDFENALNSPGAFKRLTPLFKYNYVQSNNLRKSYNTMEKIEKMQALKK